jgi:hypothetical protein
MRRVLAARDPARFERDLATSLTMQGSVLAINGALDQGIDALTEGVEIRRKLAKAEPATHAQPLIAALNDLSRLQEQAHQPGPALDAAQEIIDHIEAMDEPSAGLKRILDENVARRDRLAAQAPASPEPPPPPPVMQPRAPDPVVAERPGLFRRQIGRWMRR